MKALQIKVTRWQRERLKEIQDHPPSSRLGKRATCLLLAADGAAVGLIQQATGLGRKAVTDIRQRFLRRGLRSLADRLHTGRPPRWVEVFWLPHYSPELNLIERIWKHLKATRIANVLFSGRRGFEAHVDRTLADFSAHPDLEMLAGCQTFNGSMGRKLVGLT